MAPKRRRALRQGVGALLKASILAFGVPLAIERLWVAAGALERPELVASEAVWIRAVLIAVALLWGNALFGLLQELRRAIRGGQQQRTNWSSRWAASIAALAIAATAGHASSSTTTAPRTSVTALSHLGATRPPVTAREPGRLRPGECLADVAGRTMLDPERWGKLAATNMGVLLAPGQRFVDPSLLRSEWCLMLPATSAAAPVHSADAPLVSHERHSLEELAWLGLGVLGTAALITRLRALRIAASAARAHGERTRVREPELEALEARLDDFGDAILIDWIDAANRLLRRSTSALGIAPTVLLVRAGPSGVTFYFNSPPAVESDVFVVGANGHAWTLPLSATLDQIITLSADWGRYAPWLIPVGDDGQDAWLVAVGPGQTLEITADATTTAEVLTGIATALRTLPWAEELGIELLGLEAPPIDEHCYQMAASSLAALVDLVVLPLPRRSDQATVQWRREPLVVSARSSEIELLPPEVCTAAGVVRPGSTGAMRLVIDDDGARLVPVGVALNVPRPASEASRLIDRLLAKASASPMLVPFTPLEAHSDAHADAPSSSRASLRVLLLSDPPDVEDLTDRLNERDGPRVIELLSYLALHNGSASMDELMSALFPRAGARGIRRLDDVLAATRRALGDRRLIGAPEHVVMIDVTVSSDWTELLATLAKARAANVSDAMAMLRQVLSKLNWQRSAPFRWMATEGLVDQLAFEICDSMHQLASLAIAEGDVELTAQSLRVGLTIEPTSELLVRDLMLLRHRVDGIAGVVESYEQLEEALAAVGGVEPSWATRALFEELAGDHASTA